MRIHVGQVCEILEIAAHANPASRDVLAGVVMSVVERAQREEMRALERKHGRDLYHYEQWIAQSFKSPVGRKPVAVAVPEYDAPSNGKKAR